MTEDHHSKRLDGTIAESSIQRCNCMIRTGSGTQMPAIRRGEVFEDPEGRRLIPPDTYEDMHWTKIKALMAERSEVYIGHRHEPFSPEAESK